MLTSMYVSVDDIKFCDHYADYSWCSQFLCQSQKAYALYQKAVH